MKSKKILSALSVALVGAMVMSGCSYIPKDATLIDINDGEDKITLGYGNFVARLTQAIYDQYYGSYYGTGMWQEDMNGEGNTFEVDMKNDLIEQLEKIYVLEKHADEYDVEITDDEEKKMEEAAASFMEDNSDDAIEQVGATEEYIVKYLEDSTIADRMETAIQDSYDPEVTDEEIAQKTITYAKWTTTAGYDSEGNYIEPSDDDIAAYKAEAKALAAAADWDTGLEAAVNATTDTESFGNDDLEDAKTYQEYQDAQSEDSDDSDSEDSNSEDADEEDSDSDSEEEEEAPTWDGLPYKVLKIANELKTGETSKAFYVKGDGYYVVHMDNADDTEAEETKKAEVISEKKSDYYDDTVQGWLDDTDFEVNEKYWDRVKFDTFFEN